jgi:hypothetical protein
LKTSHHDDKTGKEKLQAHTTIVYDDRMGKTCFIGALVVKENKTLAVEELEVEEMQI